MNKVLSIVGGLVACGAAFVAAYNGVGGSIESKIERVANETNKTLPKQLDEVTRLDRVEAGAGKTLTFLYTVTIGMTQEEKQLLQSTVTQMNLSKQELKPIFDAGVTVVHKYRDPQGALVHEFQVKR